MQTSSPLARYEQALSQGEFKPDDVQRDAITRLDVLQQGLIARKNSAAPSAQGLFGRLSKLIGKEKSEVQPPVRGLYMWGGVGRGKTWVMDLFFSLFLAIANCVCTSTDLCCGYMKN